MTSRVDMHTIDPVFTICIRNENQNQTSFHPFGPHDIFVLIELTLGHLRHHLTDVPPQSNSPPDNVLRKDHSGSSKLPLALHINNTTPIPLFQLCVIRCVAPAKLPV